MTVLQEYRTSGLRALPQPYPLRHRLRLRHAAELPSAGYHQGQSGVPSWLEGSAREGGLRPHDGQTGIVPLRQLRIVRCALQREGIEDESGPGHQVSGCCLVPGVGLEKSRAINNITRDLESVPKDPPFCESTHGFFTLFYFSYTVKLVVVSQLKASVASRRRNP